MAHIDALSRNPNPTEKKNVFTTLLKEDDWVLTTLEANPQIKSIKDILTSKNREQNKSTFTDYELKRGKVYKRTPHGSRVFLPKTSRWQILRFNHDDIGHFPFDETFEYVSSKFWFPRMRRFIEKYVGACINCMYHKTPSGRKPEYLHPIHKIPRPSHIIHVHHLWPFVKGKRGNTHILVTVDAFTKFCFIKAVKSTRTKYVLEELEGIVKIFGAPKRIVTDRGKCFAKPFKEFCEKRKINHHHNAVGMPRGNGQVERYNKTVLNSLSTMGADRDDAEWDENISNVQLGLNNTLNRALNSTPADVFLGCLSGPHNFASVDEEDLVDVLNLRKTVC
nr:unnamed protein product [Callosobruchus analis]